MVDRGMFDKQGFFLLDPRLDLRLRSQIPVGAAHAKLLPPNYHPGNWDVICHSGKDIHDHIGNQRFRICIENHLSIYVNAKSRSEKSAIISGIVTSIRESSTQGGGFVRLDGHLRRWYEVGDKVARDKVGQSLRDCSGVSARQKRKRAPSTEGAPRHPDQIAYDPSIRQPTQESTKDSKTQKIEFDPAWFTSTDEPMFYGTPGRPLAKAQRQGELRKRVASTTNPRYFLPYEEAVIDGIGTMRLQDEKDPIASTKLFTGNFPVDQNIFDWFEADMQET